MRTLFKICGSILVFSLFFLIFTGAVLLPARVVEASFFSSLFSNQALADASGNINTNTDTSSDTMTPPVSGDNSQNIALLQANVSSISVLQDKNNSVAGDNTNPSDSGIVSDNALLSATGPMGVSDGTDTANSSSGDDTSVYVVRQGDTVAAIAKLFGVSVNTILSANGMKKGDKLTEGEVLFILPVSGIELTITKGQTLQSIAKLYNVDVNDIASYNGIAIDSKLAVGDQLMIPNAEQSQESDKPVQDLNASIAKDKLYYEQHPVQNLAGYFIDPVPGYRLSQGIHDNNAVDLAIAKGTPIHAAASGTVILARNGYNGGFGNVVIIDHTNGTQTLYAHQSKIATTTGAEVTQGQVIGYVGSTGHSTGPHLHFEVHGAQNPGADGSWEN